MQNHIRRYLNRIFILAIFETAMVLCLISAARLFWVRNALQTADKAVATGQPLKSTGGLRLAYRWSAAYPAFTEPLQKRYREAVEQTGDTATVPGIPERTFTAAIPPLEKALILPDMLVNLVYKKMQKPGNLRAPQRMQQPTFQPAPDETAGEPSVAVSELPYQDHATTVDGGSEAPPATPENTVATAPDAPAIPPPDPNAMWGAVMTQEAAVYDRNGKKTRTVPAGSLVDVHRTQNTPNGEFILCSVRSRQGSLANVILRREDVELYTGAPLAASSMDQRKLVSKRGELLAAIDTRRKDLERSAVNKNPHQEEYRDVLRKYKAINDESESLKKEYETSTGARRVELGNRLRKLKNDQLSLMPEYQETKKKKEAWDSSNQANRTPPDEDPQIQQLKRQLDQIDTQLRNV